MAAGTALARPWPNRRSTAAPLLVLLVLLVASAVSFASLLVAGINRADEIWNLHLIDRMLGGDAPYRDFRYYPTPLALLVGLGTAQVFGAQLLMLKALVAVSFGITTAANLLVVRMLSGGRRAQVLVVVGSLLFALPPPSSLYNTLAITFVSLTLLAVLRWDAALAEEAGRARSRRLLPRAVVVGLAAGACVLTKYNVGTAVALAVAGSFTMALVQRRIAWRDFLASSATAAGAALVTLVAGMSPVLLQGAADDFVRQLLDASSLLDASLPYGPGWERLVEGVQRLDAADMRTFASYALLPLAALAGTAAVVRTQGVVRGRLFVLCLFSLAAAVVAVPRADHVVWAAPLPLTLLVASGMRLVRRWADARPVLTASVRSLVLGFTVTWLVLAVVNEGAAARELERVRTGPLAGALLPAGRWRDLTAEAAEIGNRIGTDRKVFMVSLEAASFYVIGDLRNPTRFHFPDAFEFGGEGLAEVKAALVNYTINYTCISRAFPPDLAPAQVIATVQAHAHLVARLRACELWRTGAGGRAR